MSVTATDYTYALYNGQTFPFGEERIGPTYCMNCICMCMNKMNLENHKKKQPELKSKESFKLNQNKKIVSYNIVQLQSVKKNSFEIRIQSSTPC
jgi:hypothetical protein